jgi:mono/diheme cytochrome c family protein
MTSARFHQLLGAISLSVVVAVAASDRVGGSAQQPPQDYNSGDYLYRVFCASCHGDRGTGDGVVAATLRVRPTDLTLISSKNGGVFPRDRVYAAIDGRRRVDGHGPGEMAIWGDVLNVTEGRSESLIGKRIDSLVRHIETIQVNAP